MTPFVSIWTNKDTSDGVGLPTVDEKGATVTADFAELTTVLHVATADGSVGLWTVAVTLDAENAVSLIEKIAERYGLTVAPQVIGAVLPPDTQCYSPHHGQDYPHLLTQGCVDQDVEYAQQEDPS